MQEHQEKAGDKLQQSTLQAWRAPVIFCVCFPHSWTFMIQHVSRRFPTLVNSSPRAFHMYMCPRVALRCWAGQPWRRASWKMLNCASLRRVSDHYLHINSNAFGGKLHDSFLKHQACKSDKGSGKRFYLQKNVLIFEILWFSYLA